MINKSIMIFLLCLIVVFLGFLIIVRVKEPLKKSEAQKDVVSMGLKPSQQKYFSQELQGTFNDVALLDKGDELIKQGRLDEAITHFNNLLKNSNFEMKGLVRNHLIDAYEKKRKYAKAHSVLYDDVQEHYKVPPTHEVRVPVEERLKYLKYASEGNYELAVKHASMALEAVKKGSLKKLPMLYENRLEDLKASEKHIRQLKK